MKNGLLKLGFAFLILIGGTSLQATKMTSHITHGTPWIETRLSYAMTVQELAAKYYGNSEETNVILKMNRGIDNNGLILVKDMMVLIPVTHSFTDQPELLGWVQ